MIVHRFMSENEYKRLMKGETLYNSKNHHNLGQSTTSVGFCFFSEPPEEAIHWLSGIVDSDYCVTFDFPDGILKSSIGRYRVPEKDRHWEIPASTLRNEYCLTGYSKNTGRIIEASDKFAGYSKNIFDLLLQIFKN